MVVENFAADLVKCLGSPSTTVAVAAAPALGEAEVGDLGGAADSEQDVRRLQVAMDDAGVVRGFESAADLPGEPHGARHRQLLLTLQDGREVVPLHVGHRDVLDALDLAEVVNAHDVLVRNLAREQQLVLEALFDF
jgi:hypothetical protein